MSIFVDSAKILLSDGVLPGGSAPRIAGWCDTFWERQLVIAIEL